MKKFEEFLSESRSKFPEYKVGDILFAKDYQEFQWDSIPDSNKWDTYTKYASSNYQGALLKVVKVNIASKEYVAEFIGGMLKTVYRGRVSSSLIAYKESRKIYLRVKHSFKLSSEGADEALKFLEKDTLEPGEKVNVKISTEKNVSREVLGIALAETVEKNKLHYIIDGVQNAVSIDRIEKEIDIKDQVAINLLAEEIAKITDTELEKTSLEADVYTFDVPMIEGKELIKGKLYFKSDAEKDKFCEDLKKFIDSKLNPKLQKVMNEGEESGFGVSKFLPSSWSKGKIRKNKIIQAARNLGINVQEFIEKKKGVISGKKYGL